MRGPAVSTPDALGPDASGAAARPAAVGWLAHPALPLASLAALALWANGLVALALLSPALPGLARVVLTLCGYDALRAVVRADALAALLVQSYAFAAIIAWLYSEDVRGLWRRGARLRALALAALAAPLLGFAAALLVGRATLTQPDGPPAVRAPLTLPDVALVDHRGAPLRTGDLRGRIVLLTFVYGECTESCPLLVRQMQAVLGRFPADVRGAELVGLAVTLDPQRDDSPALARAAERWRLTDPRLRLVTGEPEAVRQLLATATLWRRTRATSGWDHANLVLVLDRDGREAFAEQTIPPDVDRLAEAVARLLRR